MSGSQEAIQACREGVRLLLRVTPRASRTEFTGLRDGRLALKVKAPPIDGAANEAVVEAIANALGWPKRAVRVTSGESSRRKTVVVDGDSVDRVAKILSVALGNAPTAGPA